MGSSACLDILVKMWRRGELPQPVIEPWMVDPIPRNKYKQFVVAALQSMPVSSTRTFS
jgi:hypothetical protein